MVILTEVKKRLGIVYTDSVKDSELTGMISGAKAFLSAAGWPSDGLTAGSESREALEAIVLWCKMAQNTDPSRMVMNPILQALIVQARTKPEEEESEDSSGDDSGDSSEDDSEDAEGE